MILLLLCVLVCNFSSESEVDEEYLNTDPNQLRVNDDFGDALLPMIKL